MEKQTAVEWLIKEFRKNRIVIPMQMEQQAKEMEKQQIIDAYKFGLSDEYVIGSENYYNETFGGKDEQ